MGIKGRCRLSLMQLVSWTLLPIILSGCGVVKLAYEEGETFTMLWASRYIDLDASQDALARSGVRAWFRWHRTTQLPDYARLAAELQQRVNGPVTASDIDAIDTQFRSRWHTMADAAAPALADLALTLRTDQLARMEKKFLANDDTYRSDFVDVSPARLQKDRFSKELDRVEYWYGSLSSAQKASLRQMTDALPVDPRLWLSERQAREKEFVALLRGIIEQKPARAEAIERIRAFARRLETSPDPTHRSYIEALDQARRAMYVNVANMATAEQREHASAALEDWIAEFNTLARDAG